MSSGAFKILLSLNNSFRNYIYIYIYVYTYIYIYIRKNKTGYIRMINLFPSRYVFLISIKNTKKIKRTSSDLMDKIIQNTHRKEGGDRRGVKIFLLI